MDNGNFCNECNKTLGMHADGSVTCACDMLDADSENIPAKWELELDDLRDAREEQRKYDANDATV